MGLFRRSKPAPVDAPPLPADAPLEEHLDAILDGRAGAVAGYVRALAGRTLWLAVAELPAGIEPGQAVTLTDPAQVRVLTSEMPDGTGTALQVFTSQEGVHARVPEAHPLAVAGTAALEQVARGYDGAIVDSHARWQTLRAEWIREALGSA